MFARKLRYGAHDGEAGAHFAALLEIARRKGGKPVGFVLYRYIRQYFCPEENRSEMIHIEAQTAEEAVKRFWPPPTKGWEKTTLWLYAVSVGGGYEIFPGGTWVKIGRPAFRAKRRRKKPLRFGNVSHIHHIHAERLCNLQRELQKLSREDAEDIPSIELVVGAREAFFFTAQGASERRAVAIAALTEQVAVALRAVNNTKAEMQQVVRRKFPEPLGITPKRSLPKKKTVIMW